MRCKQWIFDMDGTLTDSMTVVWRGAWPTVPATSSENTACP